MLTLKRDAAWAYASVSAWQSRSALVLATAAAWDSEQELVSLLAVASPSRLEWDWA